MSLAAEGTPKAACSDLHWAAAAPSQPDLRSSSGDGLPSRSSAARSGLSALPAAVVGAPVVVLVSAAVLAVAVAVCSCAFAAYYPVDSAPNLHAPSAQKTARLKPR